MCRFSGRLLNSLKSASMQLYMQEANGCQQKGCLAEMQPNALKAVARFA